MYNVYRFTTNCVYSTNAPPNATQTQSNLMTRSIWVRLPYLDSPFRLADRCRRRRRRYFFFFTSHLESTQFDVLSVCGNVHIVNNEKRKKKKINWNFEILFIFVVVARARAMPLGWAFRIFIDARQSFSVTFVAFLRHRHNHGPKIQKTKTR